MEKLKVEIRGRFNSVDEITVQKVNTCAYLRACVEEALRIYPPAPDSHTRITPPEGVLIDGYSVPGGMGVGVPIYSACRSPLNFKDPDKFVPERWTGEDPAYDGDHKDAAQFFSFGPRNCIGKNLAYVEARLIIAKLIWLFDWERCFNESWVDQKIYIVWDKGPLMMKLKPVQRD